MTTNQPNARSNLRIVLVVVAAAGLVASGLVLRESLKLSMVTDYPEYPTVDALSAASDAVVSGQLGESIGKFEDRGGDPEVDEFGDRIPGVPMEVFAFKVTESSSPHISAGDVIPVLWIDSGAVRAEDLTPLRTGDDLVLFLEHLTASNAPDLAKVTTDAWVPVSGDNGVMEMSSDGVIAIPRSPVVETSSVVVDELFR